MSSGSKLFLKLLVLLAILLSGGSVFSFYSVLYDQNEVLEPTVILVEKGETLNQIATRLKKDGLLESVAVFKVAARLSGKATRLKAGEYRIPPRASARLILDILVGGQTVVRRVTIPEGKTSRQIYDLLMQTPGLSGDLPPPPSNGSLLPETYVFSYGVPRKVIAKRMKESLTQTIDELWQYRHDDLPYKTKEEALVLASIVEKETALPEERPRVAAVFVNRLRKGMRLQTDPTVIYAVTDGSMELKRRLTLRDLRTPHPYNTYVNRGLPPAPICNPGRDSILAVLQPLKTNEIYFVADGSGGHVFSRTYDEHKRNISSWKKVRAQKKENKRQERLAAIRAKKKAEEDAKKAAALLEAQKMPPAVGALENLLDETIEEEPVDPEDVSLDIVDAQSPDQTKP